MCEVGGPPRWELINAVWTPGFASSRPRPSFIRLTEEEVTLREPGRPVAAGQLEHPVVHADALPGLRVHLDRGVERPAALGAHEG
jgi:hypothetical protein